MIPGVRPITLVRGDALSFAVTVTEPVTPGTPAGLPVPLTGYTARAHLRKNTDLASPLIAAFTVDLLDQDAHPGMLRVSLGPAITATLSDLIGCPGVWDLEIFTNDGVDNTTIVTGPVRVIPDVTRVSGDN